MLLPEVAVSMSHQYADWKRTSWTGLLAFTLCAAVKSTGQQSLDTLLQPSENGLNNAALSCPAKMHQSHHPSPICTFMQDVLTLTVT